MKEGNPRGSTTGKRKTKVEPKVLWKTVDVAGKEERKITNIALEMGKASKFGGRSRSGEGREYYCFV